MHSSIFCLACNKRVRSEHHLCQPSAIRKYDDVRAAQKAQLEPPSKK